MNYDQFKNNVGYRIQLQPAAIWLDEDGFERPALENDWIIESVTPEAARLTMVGSLYFHPLGLDHIKDFKTDPSRSRRGGIRYGFLTLTVQIYIQGIRVFWRPTLRPGERLPPPSPKVIEMIVDFNFPSDSGIQANLDAMGFDVSWALESRLARLTQIGGWQVVLEQGEDGALYRFRVRDRKGDDQILIKRRR